MSTPDLLASDLAETTVPDSTAHIGQERFRDMPFGWQVLAVLVWVLAVLAGAAAGLLLSLAYLAWS